MYDIVLADPPWRYEQSRSTSRKIENQYPTMEVEDIAALPVATWANPDSACYMWATSPKLPEALRVMEAWGFEYRTCMVWDKQIIGMGYWCRGQHELLLIGRRGSFAPPAQETRRSSVISHRRMKHSRKPEEVAEMIDQQFPQATKIELFARRTRQGWDVWGNQVEQSAPLFEANQSSGIVQLGGTEFA